MLRFSVVLVVFVATLATGSDLMAQSGNPVRDVGRNIGRQLGMGWGAGYHSGNPGPISHYYSPWSTSNVPAYPMPHDPNFDSSVSRNLSNQVPQQTAIHPKEQFPVDAPGNTVWPLMSTFRPIKALNPVFRK